MKELATVHNGTPTDKRSGHGAQQNVVGDAGAALPVAVEVLAVQAPPSSVVVSRKSAGCCTGSQENGGMYVIVLPLQERFGDAKTSIFAWQEAPLTAPHVHAEQPRPSTTPP
jgi:hypothetical protein